MSYKTMLTKEIENEFEELGKMEVGTEVYETTVNGLTKLMDKKLEIDQFEADCFEKRTSQGNDYELKTKQIENERKDQIVKNVLTAASFTLTFCATIWGTLKSFEFEKEGTVTTIMGRGFIQKLLPKK